MCRKVHDPLTCIVPESTDSMTVLIIVEVSLTHEIYHQKDLFWKPKCVNFMFVTFDLVLETVTST